MTTQGIINDKSMKAKAKVQALGNAILEQSISIHDIFDFAINTTETNKATCLEALEFATKQKPGIADKTVFELATQSLTDKAPRVKWESAKMIGNVAHLFTQDLENAIPNLLINAEDEGTVVRWATAYALGEILKLKTEYNKKLLPAIKEISAEEQDNGVKKKYIDAIKKVNK